MPCSWLDTVRKVARSIGNCRTAGVRTGVRKVSSGLSWVPRQLSPAFLSELIAHGASLTMRSGENDSGIESIPEAADVVVDEQDGKQVESLFAQHPGRT